MPKGKPTSHPKGYTPELAALFCLRIAEGRTVRSVCNDPDMPSRRKFYEWLNAYSEFCEQYARAKELHADSIADECFEIADNSQGDTLCDEFGNEKPNHEYIQRSKLRIDTRKWYLSKILPKKYGDKVEQTIVGDAEKPVHHKVDLKNASHDEVMNFIRGKTHGE